MTNNYEEYDIEQILNEVPSSNNRPLAQNISDLNESYTSIVSY